MTHPTNLTFGDSKHDFAYFDWRNGGHLCLINDKGDEVTVTKGLLQCLGLVA